MGDETRYLEGQYDGSGLQRSVQHMGDLLQAHEMEQEVKEVQQNLWEREEGRIAQIYDVDRGGSKRRAFATRAARLAAVSWKVGSCKLFYYWVGTLHGSFGILYISR